jgi:L-threonylcarbamoyladenylate synthase
VEDNDIITTAMARTILSGGLVIFPTETIYGLGCVATETLALQRLFAVKGRSPEQPPPVLFNGQGQLELLVAEISDVADDLMRRYWPGSLTLILPARAGLPALLTGVTSDKKKFTIGVRESAHPVARALCAAVGVPIVATSANRSGATGAAAAPRALHAIDASLKREVDVIIDGGEVGGVPSTIVDCTGVQPMIVRQGAVQVEW